MLRGPGALLYGGNAMGGVVNLIDNRIPREPLQGTSGRANLGYASGSREASGAAMVESGNDRSACTWTRSAAAATTSRCRSTLACTQGGVTRVRERICNSAGAVARWRRRRLAVLRPRLPRRFGRDLRATTTARSPRTRPPSACGRPAPGSKANGATCAGPLQSIKAQASHTDYRHTEYEAGVPGTVFRNDGSDLRLQARHVPLGALHGVVGLQVERTRFSADGEEAFAPNSRTGQVALFAYEHWDQPWGKVTGGLRGEQVTVESLGHPTLERFSPAKRSFSPVAVPRSAGQWNLAPAVAG